MSSGLDTIGQLFFETSPPPRNKLSWKTAVSVNRTDWLF